MTCGTCFGEYDDNKRLPLNLECGHTFCWTCIQQFMKNTRLECP